MSYKKDYHRSSTASIAAFCLYSVIASPIGYFYFFHFLVANVAVSLCYKKTLPFYWPHSSVNVFLRYLFLSGFSTFGCLQAALYYSPSAILSRLKVKSKCGPISLNGSFLNLTSSSLNDLRISNYLQLILFTPSAVKIMTLFNSATLTSSYYPTLKKSMRKLLNLLCFSEKSNCSP